MQAAKKLNAGSPLKCSKIRHGEVSGLNGHGPAKISQLELAQAAVAGDACDVFEPTFAISPIVPFFIEESGNSKNWSNIRRETAARYLKAAGIAVRAVRWLGDGPNRRKRTWK